MKTLSSSFFPLGHGFIKKHSWQGESVCTQPSEYKKEIAEIKPILQLSGRSKMKTPCNKTSAFKNELNIALLYSPKGLTVLFQFCPEETPSVVGFPEVFGDS